MIAHVDPEPDGDHNILLAQYGCTLRTEGLRPSFALDPHPYGRDTFAS